MDQIFKAIITIGNSLVVSFIIWYIPYKLRRMEDKLEEINKRTKLANIKIDITYYESLIRLESILIKQEKYEEANLIHKQIQSFLKRNQQCKTKPVNKYRDFNTKSIPSPSATPASPKPCFHASSPTVDEKS